MTDPGYRRYDCKPINLLTYMILVLFSILLLAACTEEMQVEVARGLEKQVEVIVTPTTPALASVPASAFGPAIPQDKGYLVEEIADGVYWVT